MRNAKKLMLLLLSLALLCGIFAVAALAEEPATEATVVYPDGSTEVVAVGETITPKTFTDGLYYGKGNTLFKDDATEGWVFTVDGAALADLTVTEAMAGKEIIASGADKVYYTSEEIAADYSSKLVYHLVADVEKYFSTSNTGDRGDGTNTGASHYQDLRRYPDGTEGRNTVKDIVVKLYEDVDVASFKMNWFIDEASRNGGRNAYLDLNGHTVVTEQTDYVEIKSLAMRLYSSQPGAHWYQPNSASAFYVSDDGTLYLGNNSDSNADYSENLSVHCKTLFNTMYGNGAYIVGGHYYQLEGATTYLVRISRRLKAMQNASFYVQDGNALLGTPDALSDNLKKATTCKFYSFGESAAVSGEKGIALTFENCAFYGINTEVAEATATLTLDEACTENAAAEFKTVTFADGTTQKFLAASLDEAKAFVESHPKANATPYAKWVDDEYFLSTNPELEIAYDADFNATVSIKDNELLKVYFAVEITGGETVYYTNAATANSDFLNYLSYMDGAGSKTVLYSDITCGGLYINGKKDVAYYIDLNGFTLTVTSMATYGAFDVRAKLSLYSSREGGVWDTSACTYALHTNDCKWDGVTQTYGDFCLGEETISGTSYYKNLTVLCQAIDNPTLHGSRVYLLGGTYIQTVNSAAEWFLQMGRVGTDSTYVQDIRNCTFVLTNPATAPFYLRHGTNNRDITDCTFISANTAGGVALSTYTDYIVATRFNKCNFVNVQPYRGSDHVVYNSCAFGTTGAYTTEDINVSADAAEYIVHGTSAKTIEANGKTYRLDGAFITDPAAALKLTHENVGTDYWAIGTTVSVALDEITKIEGDKLICGAYYDYSAIDAIEGGVVTKAGEATAPISFSLIKDLAFKYEDANGNVFGVTYEECGETAKGVGDKFHELFSNPVTAYEIVMYKDMCITKGVHFGPLVATSDSKHNRDYYNSFVNGSIIWDLNGTTVTIDKDVTGLVNLAAANYALATPTVQNAYKPAVFGFENNGTDNGLTLKSSKAGAQIINESSAYTFGVGEGKKAKVTINGENITMIAMNTLIIGSLETGGSHLTINGGTYIGGSTAGVIRLSYNSTISNATIINANANAGRVIQIDGYREATDTFVNCTFVAAKPGANFAAIDYGSKSFTLKFNGCTFIGVTPATVGGKFTAVNYEDGGFASNAADLAILYAAAPEGKTLAFTSVSVNGENYRVLGYFAAADLVTVEIPRAGITELWLAGSTFISDATNADISVVEKDGVYYYLSNPVWTGKIGDAVVENILAPENAGETVVLDVEGELEKLYFVREVAGVKTYYYGDVEKVNAEIVAVLAKMGDVSSTITMMNDFALTATSQDGVQIVNAGGKTHKIDLNGFTLSFTHKDISYALKFQNGSTFVYSSKEGGVLDASAAKTLLMTDGAGNAYIGEPANDGSATYGKNLTVICKVLFSRLWSNNADFIGGTYVQAEGYVGGYFIDSNEGPVPTFRNSTFIVKAVTKGILGTVSGTYTNCIFIAEDASNLLAKNGKGDKNATFVDCYFYNVIPNAIEGLPATYTDCRFNVSAALASGFVAFGGEKVTLNVNGVDYVFDAALVENAALVNWGFGITEYWAIGATASRADAVIDGFFTYGFESFVVEGDAAPAATLKAIVNGGLQMSLTLQDKIGVNLFFAEALADAIVKFGGAEIALADRTAEEGFYKLSTAIAPNVANLTYNVILVIGENEHVIPLSVGTYAEKILAGSEHAAVHNLTYAMVEYVRAMTGDASFLADVQAPAGYEAQLPGEAAYEKGENTLLTGLRFNLSGTIALEIAGADAKGMEVTLVLANGRTEVATVDETGSAIFVGLYVNDFAGEMEITVGEEVYSYSIENYYNALDAEDSKEDIAALYNYAQYAAAYVELLQNAD